MIHEIKFRAISYLNNEWIKGYLSKRESLFFIQNTYSVKERTIGQFTGLKDKNGNEIYEGDNLKFTNLNGECRYFKIWREKGGLVMNTHQDDYYKPTNEIAFYDAIADMQTASFIEGNCEIINKINYEKL